MNRRRSPAALCLALLAASCVPRGAPPVALPPPAPAATVAPVLPPAPRPERAAVDPQVRAELRRGAVARTLSAKALLDEAIAAGAERERHALLLRALNAYGLAAREWTRFFALDPDAADGAETRYWVADAWHRIVVIEDAVDGTPSPEELAAARVAAVGARATNGGVFREAAAGMAVGIADLALKLQHRLHARTHGAQGVAERREVRLTGEGMDARAEKDPLPREVEEAIAARDAYLEHVPAGDDPGGKRADLAFQAADFHFLYGHFAEARRRFVALRDPLRCGPSVISYRAWARLMTMASLEQDIPAARALADAMGKIRCDPGVPRPPPPVPYPFVDAYHLFQRAERAPPGPERDRYWRDAARAYGEQLHRAPDHDAAPEAVINGAYAYKQIGAYAEALALYRLLLDRYGSEASFARLETGDPRATPPRPADPRRYGERVRYTQMAAEALAAAHVSTFDFVGAAAAFDVVAANRRFPPGARRDAARNAAVLHAGLGNRDRTLAARQVFAHLGPPPAGLAEVDWLVARASLGLWDERSPDAGENRAARLAALAEVERFAAHYEASPDAARLVVEAAHTAARLRRAAGDPRASVWCALAVRVFERPRPVDPRVTAVRSPEAELAGSCAQVDLDASVRADFGSPSAPRRYRGDGAAVERAFLSDLARVQTYGRRIDDLARRFGPGSWLVASRAELASLVDACRAGLAPHAAKGGLRDLLRGAEERATRATMEVAVLAGALQVTTAEVMVARRRLAALATRLGEPAMRALSAGIVDPVSRAPFAYREGMFSSPPGMTEVGGDGLAPPLPVVE